MTRTASRLPCLLFAALTLLVCRPLPAAVAKEHPIALRAFLERREECDHWRGEASPDKARQRDIDRAVCRTCAGTDAQLARLKKKYRANDAVMDVLDELEDRIELPDKAAAQRFCRRLEQAGVP